MSGGHHLSALVAADVHFTSGDLFDVGYQNSIIRTGFEGKDVPHRYKDGIFVPDEKPFKGWLLGLTTTATDADFPGEYQAQMNPQLAANEKGKRYASQISVWLMASASKARVRGGGEATVKPRSETVGVTFFHELAIHVFFRLVKAPPEVDRHGFGEAWADQFAGFLAQSMRGESEDEIANRLYEEAER